MTPLSAVVLLTLLGVVLLAPRRWALFGMLAGVFFLTQAASINLLGLNLYPLRFLELTAFARVVTRGELTRSRLNRIDVAVLVLYNYTALVWILQSREFSAQQIALAVDASLCYLAFRGLMETLDDLRWVLGPLAVLLVPYTALVFVERVTASTAFGLLGAHWGLYIREGVPRCQGSFRHPILLGSVAASFLALYIGVWLADRRRATAALGAVLCLVLVGLSHSGGPATSAGAVIFGWLLWRMRDRMRLVRWTAAAVFVFLLFYMKAPIWYLPFKISAIVGGGGYHRSVLMERAWQHLGEWWLAGMDIGQTLAWLPYVHDMVGGADITNQFIAFGIKAGLAAVLMAFAVFGLSFQGIGRSLMVLQHRPDGAGRADSLLLWGLGVALLSHAASWIGVAYFDQSWAVWLLHVAAVAGGVQVLKAVEVTSAPASSRVRKRRREAPRSTGTAHA